MPRITSKGQVTIPKNIRQVLGVKPGDQVEFELLSDQRVIVKPVLATAVFERYVGYLTTKDGAGSQTASSLDESQGRRMITAVDTCSDGL